MAGTAILGVMAMRPPSSTLAPNMVIWVISGMGSLVWMAMTPPKRNGCVPMSVSTVMPSIQLESRLMVEIIRMNAASPSRVSKVPSFMALTRK